MATITPTELEEIKDKKVELMKKMLSVEPPEAKGDDIIELWETLYDDTVRSIVVDTVSGPSDEATNPVLPYQKIRALVGDGGNWKWPRMWQRFDEIERRGPAYRNGEVINFQGPNKNPEIIAQKVLVVGGGPIGLRCAIEMKMAGHDVTLVEKRREIRAADGELTQLGFTNRINRPHMWNYVRNDLDKLNGRDLMSRQVCYPVFTEPETSSIGIDELQCLLLKNVLLLGVDTRLGVGFEDSSIKIHPKSCKPQWAVKLSYDEKAAASYGGAAGEREEIFDCLIGCDGPRSQVRLKQQKLFGNIEKRKFMDCVGIVANVQKLSRKRLKELEFPHGQEPSDMNRTKMVFGSFFKKIEDECDAELESFIYYKASYHNYIILTPKRQNMIKHGLPGQVYHFSEGRAGAGRVAEKAKLIDYVGKILKSAGIPVDPELSNDGFVNPPNDCMAFDFAECWNTQKSLNFQLAPPDYDVDEHGPWCGPKLVPFIALCGDALLEPFWPLGLGLKRGWQAVMDTAYAIDNMYNRTMYCAELNKDPDTFSWDDHWEVLQERCKENFDSCNRVEVAEELGKGEYNGDGIVMLQWKKYGGDAERPMYLVEVDPNTRYKKRNLTLNSAQKRMMLDDKDWRHPIVARYLAIKEYNDTVKKEPEKNGWQKMKSINGKTLAVQKSGYTFKAAGKKADAPAAKPFCLPKAEIAQVSLKKRESLMQAVTGAQIDKHVTAASSQKRASMAAQQKDLLAGSKMFGGGGGSIEDMHDLAHTHHAEDVAARSEGQWNRMLEKDLDATQNAELQHVRNMISALETSIAGYRQAEKAILMSAGKK